MMEEYDKIIIGAGWYGLYSALYALKRGERVLVLERDGHPFSRATYINQARVHNGYHYPRSVYTAIKSAGYFERFNKDYSFCIHNSFNQIYATSAQYSWTNSRQFKDFCKSVNIPYEELNPGTYFKPNMCEGAFSTKEYTYDAHILLGFLTEQLKKYGNKATLLFGAHIAEIGSDGQSYIINTADNNAYKSRFVLNATYASTNQIRTCWGLKNSI